MVRQEGDQVVVLLAGMLGEEPPTGHAGLLAYAESLPGHEIADVVRSGVPLGEPAKMRYPASVRRHYEKLDRHLGGFLVIGDALCSFNPVYGQGMTVAALEAQALRELLAAGTDRLAERFFTAAAGLLGAPWTLAVGGDLRFPAVAGRRQPVDGLINRYLDRYRRAASVDPVLAGAFLRVSNLLAPPAALFAPGLVLRGGGGPGGGAPPRRAGGVGVW
ncbi:hypothetical protein [Actinoplanes sp. NPDC051494]|uniref:hypothetical protein n=1 Tax=Actinoplanes sp. NPDC051494 TaxID=3363907 RepID=UPI00378799B2